MVHPLVFFLGQYVATLLNTNQGPPICPLFLFCFVFKNSLQNPCMCHITCIKQAITMCHCHQKRRGGDFEMVIPIILNVSSTRFTRNLQGAIRRLQQILLLNLNPSSQTNFIILTQWTSRDHTSLDFLSRSQLVVDECGNSSFNNKNPTNATPTSSCSFIQKLERD